MNTVWRKTVVKGPKFEGLSTVQKKGWFEINQSLRTFFFELNFPKITFAKKSKTFLHPSAQLLDMHIRNKVGQVNKTTYKPSRNGGRIKRPRT